MTRSLMMAALLLTGSAFAADPALPERDFDVKAAGSGLDDMETRTLAQGLSTSPAVLEGAALTMRNPTQANDDDGRREIALRETGTSPVAADAKHKATKLEPAAGQIRW